MTTFKLLLSGGGFRATLFHLGVLRYLKETRRLELVKEVYSVSGGSIIAAHFATNYLEYTANDDKQFNEVANDLIAFVQSGHREKTIRLRLLFWIFVLFCLVTSTLFLLGVARAEYPIWGIVFFLLAITVQFFFLRWWERWTRPINVHIRACSALYNNKSLGSLVNVPIILHLLSTNLTTGKWTPIIGPPAGKIKIENLPAF